MCIYIYRIRKVLYDHNCNLLEDILYIPNKHVSLLFLIHYYIKSVIHCIIVACRNTELRWNVK